MSQQIWQFRFLRQPVPHSLPCPLQGSACFLLALLWYWEAGVHPGSAMNSFAVCPSASQWPSGDFSFPICTMKVWAQTRYFHVLGGATLESWGGWMGRAAPSVSVLHIGVLVNLLKQGSVAANLLERQWAERLGKPFSRADILFLPSLRTLGTRVKEWGRLPGFWTPACFPQ